MPEIIDFDLSQVKAEELLKFFDLMGAAKYIVSKTPTKVDDFLLPYVADIIKEQLEEWLSPKDDLKVYGGRPSVTEEEIRKKVKELGLALSPTLILFLLKMSWPLVEKLLERWASR